MKDSNTNSPAASGVTPGVILKEMRERQGLSVVDAASRLCLSVQFVEDIERDDYSQMSARVYARGHIISYAHLLGVPESEILSALANTNMKFAPPKNPIPSNEQRSIPIYQSTETSQQHSGLILWGSILVLMIVIGLVMLWWKGPTSAAENKAISANANQNSTEIPVKPETPKTVTPPAIQTSAPAPALVPGAIPPPASTSTAPVATPSSGGSVMAPAAPVINNNAVPPANGNGNVEQQPKLERKTPPTTGYQDQPEGNQVAQVNLPPPSDSDDN
jgi:cytoskeleton protein RodZ